MRTTWGQEEWKGVHFNEANARRVAEAEAERDRVNLLSCLWYVLLLSAPFWVVVAVLVVFW